MDQRWGGYGAAGFRIVVSRLENGVVASESGVAHLMHLRQAANTGRSRASVQCSSCLLAIGCPAWAARRGCVRCPLRALERHGSDQLPDLGVRARPAESWARPRGAAPA